MIYKEQGNLKMHRLRVNHIYETDYNFLVRIVRREAIQHVQQLGKINQGQYGGCPGRDCTSVTYLEELRRDISIMTRTAYANFDNDAASCYDQILMSVVSISGRKYRGHKKIVYVHAATLEKAEYKLKLSSETSNTSYRHCKKFPIHGTGQGSGNSPMIWCFISIILFDCHNQKAHGITSATPNGDVVLLFSIIGFVDDSTCVTGGKQNETIYQFLERVKYDSQFLHDLLWASVGKLELQKCGFHLIFYDFDQHRVPSMRKVSDLVITLENEKGEDIEMRTKQIDEARKNLGHWKEPEEIKSPKQFPVSLQTAIDTSDAIFTAGVTRKEVAMLYQGVYQPKVEDPLGQTFLTDKQIEKIESASLPKIIAKCGYNRNMARDIRGGQKELGGTGFTAFLNTIGATRVQHLLKNWRTPNEDIGKTRRVSMAWTQYCAGAPYPILLKTKQDLQRKYNTRNERMMCRLCILLTRKPTTK